jgi:hypothetical protein
MRSRTRTNPPRWPGPPRAPEVSTHRSRVSPLSPEQAESNQALRALRAALPEGRKTALCALCGDERPIAEILFSQRAQRLACVDLRACRRRRLWKRLAARRRGKSITELLPSLVIERIHSLNGDDDDLGWYARGHHDEAAFRAALKVQADRHPCEAEESRCEFRHTHWRKVPRGDGMQFHEARPNTPGAFAVTVLAVPEASW